MNGKLIIEQMNRLMSYVPPQDCCITFMDGLIYCAPSIDMPEWVILATVDSDGASFPMALVSPEGDVFYCVKNSPIGHFDHVRQRQFEDSLEELVNNKIMPLK